MKDQSLIGTQAVPEVVIVGDDDGDDDDVSVIYVSTPFFSGGAGSCKSNAISVEDYSEDRDLRIAIKASLSSLKPRKNANGVIDLSQENGDYGDDEVIQVIVDSSSFVPRSRKLFKGESSTSKPPQPRDDGHGQLLGDGQTTFMCEICADVRMCRDLFRIMGCTHSYCSDCMAKYVAAKLQDNIVQIPCPVSGCIGLLEPEHCRSILPSQVFDRWGTALCEAVILASQKFYCPFKDCSALLIDDRNGDTDGEVITQSECPNCWRLFCVRCKVPWHSGFECAEFEKLNKDERESEDIMLMNLAKSKNWKRCPKCRFYVEKSQGCLFMRCRCGHTFCYNCGASTKRDHYCPNCKH